MTDFLKASKESNRDLAIEAKLDKLANAAIKSTHKEKMIKYKPKVNQPIVKSSSYTSELDKRDYVLDAKADKIALANIPDPLGFRQTQSFKSPVTEEMIAEAQAESQKIVPIVINGRNYKFNPSSLPPPDLEPLPVLRGIASDADITNAVQNKQQSVAQIQRLNEEIRQLNEDENLIDNQYNVQHPIYQAEEARLRNMTKAQIVAESRKSSISAKLSKNEIIMKILYGTEGDPKIYHEDKKKITDRRALLFSELADHESNIGEIDRFIEQEAIDRKENDAAVRAVEKVNREKLTTYAQDLEAMNRGKLTVEQMPNESLEDYRQRLIDTGNTPLTDEEIKDSANLTNTLKAKQNLSQLINNKGKVETAVKMLSDDERYLLNKEFSRIKKIFIDNYGTNNKDVTEQDIVDLVHDVLNTPLVKSNMNTALVPATAQPPIIVRAAPVDYSSLNAIDGLKRFAEVNGVPLAGVRTIPAIVKQIENIIRGRTGGMPNELPIELIHKIPKGTREKLRDEGYLQNYGGGGGGGGSSAEATGSGLKSGIPEYPKFIKFGKVMISPDKLYFKNMLLIRNPHGRALTGIPNTKVSDVMVSILMKCLEGQKISKSELNLLSQHERHLYDNLMWMSGGHKIHEHTIMESAKEMKHRLSLIEGELDAGNNSELIKKELHHLLHRMARSGLISISNAASYYKEMKMHYFPQNKK